MRPWKRIAIDEPIKVGWRKLTRKVFLDPDGNEQEFYTYEAPGLRHGAVVAITEDRQVVLIEQFRPGPEKIVDDLPGGNIKDGEDPEKGVTRELLEETGYQAGRVTHLGDHSKDDYHNATWSFYLAEDCRKIADQNLDEGEFVQVKLVSIKDFLDKALRGEIADAAAVLMAYNRLQEIDKEGND